jgi:peptide deformylase
MKLRLLNDPVLREPTVPVEKTELDYIKSLVPEMTKIMKYEDGTGLAANQVGISKRFFIMKRGEEVNLIINPEIVEIGPLEKYNEGCLSIPGTSAETQRALTVKLKFRNEYFDEYEQVFSDIEAVTVQHEVDHLDGKLYIDQLLPMRRLLTLDKHRKFIKTKGRRK